MTQKPDEVQIAVDNACAILCAIHRADNGNDQMRWSHFKSSSDKSPYHLREVQQQNRYAMLG